MAAVAAIMRQILKSTELKADRVKDFMRFKMADMRALRQMKIIYGSRKLLNSKTCDRLFSVKRAATLQMITPMRVMAVVRQVVMERTIEMNFQLSSLSSNFSLAF